MRAWQWLEAPIIPTLKGPMTKQFPEPGELPGKAAWAKQRATASGPAVTWHGGPGNAPLHVLPSLLPITCCLPPLAKARRRRKARGLVNAVRIGFCSRFIFCQLHTSHPNIICYRTLLSPKRNAYLLYLEFFYIIIFLLCILLCSSICLLKN